MINKNILFPVLALGVFGACSDNACDPVPAKAGVHISVPADIDISGLRDGSLTFYNISSGESLSTPCGAGLSVETMVQPGVYNISYSATVTLANGVEAALRGQIAGVQITPGGASTTLSTFAAVDTDDLIISELFFTGTLQTSGNQYNGDQYIKLYNNTGHTVYADGLTIFESQFLTTQKFNYTPDLIASDVSVDALYTIPGSGTDYPVEPGEELLIADIAIDHREINRNSFDLSHADFEWYDQSSTPAYTDIDNPAVENLDKWYCYTLSIWQLHNRGLKAYGIARIPVDKDEYLSGYRYTVEYDQTTAAGTFPMSKTCYRLPNEWVVDIVNCSVESEYLWNVCTPALDMGWTHCGTVDGDKNRYFHAVRRKVLTLGADGHPLLSDTNNSSQDFNSFVTPSEIERQGTAAGIDGKPASTQTYDGVMPK